MKMHMMKKNEKNNEEKRVSFFFRASSKHLPFAVHAHDFSKIENAEQKLQDFIKYLEKKFDVIWYMGTDMFEDGIYERFMFHKGGFMEICLKGEIKCFFPENKCAEMQKAFSYALQKTCRKSAMLEVLKNVRMGQKLINLDECFNKEEK